MAYAAINTDDALSTALDTMIESLSENEWGTVERIETDLGVHGTFYGVDEDCFDYVAVGMVLGGSKPGVPVYAEIEDGTYGELKAFRFYAEDLGVEVE